jgi:hypothetical protein
MNIMSVVIKRNSKVTDDEAATCEKIFKAISRLENFDKPHGFLIAIALAEFAVIFRKDNGIQAMWDYIEWCKKHDGKSRILAGVMHDLNGRNDRLMSPRTAGYLGCNDPSLKE